MPKTAPSIESVTVAPTIVFGTVKERVWVGLLLLRLVTPLVWLTPVSLAGASTGGPGAAVGARTVTALLVPTSPKAS